MDFSLTDHQKLIRDTVRQFMESKALGEAGARLVIEEFLAGEAASFHVFADGSDFQPMVAAQDHKRRFDGDAGPNTGGMGAYSPVPEVDAQVVEDVLDLARLESLISGDFLVLDRDGLRATAAGRQRLNAVLAALLA